ncbi:MAG: hypothetical protein HY698_12440 [Deltaproteobacteria bacterium]|nr:hypothetical protein [Deltaproteobacteria bacterium]
MRSTLRVAAVLALGIAAVGCAEEREPRSYVQPNVIKKTDLAGTWYYKGTVIDNPAITGPTFKGYYAAAMDKITFEIREDVLIARRTYETFQGAEDEFREKKEGAVAQPIAAWRVSHLDIIRDYNAATGEETNVIRESTERPWYERDFIRVDWSESLITNYYDPLFTFDDIQVDPVSYFVTDPNDPDAFHAERDKNKSITYFDFVNKLSIKPLQQAYEDEDGHVHSFPACYFLYQPWDCNAQIARIRYSFLKVDPRRQEQFDFIPWSDQDQKLFGFFDSERKSYNRQYGATLSGRAKLNGRFRLWKEAYEKNADGTLKLVDGKVVPLAHDKREVEPILYYPNSEFPDSLRNAGQKIMDEWDVAFKATVTGLGGQLPSDGHVVVWCPHNPTQAGDPKQCLEHAANAKHPDGVGVTINDGDLRFNLLAWVNEHQTTGPLGFGPSFQDPETGETIQAEAWVYGAALDTYATWGRDQVLLLLGKIDPKEYIKGVNVSDYVKKMRYGKMDQPTYTPEDIARAYSKMRTSFVKDSNTHVKLDLSNPWKIGRSLRNRIEAVTESGVLGDGLNRVADALANLRARDPGLERRLLTPELMQANGDLLAQLGLDPSTDPALLPQSVVEKASPLSYGKMFHKREALRRRAARHAIDFWELDAGFTDDSVAGVAKELAAKFNLDTEEGKEEARKWIREQVYIGVALHEVGHNFGLRHNFSGSFDAMNYHDKYWQLRTKNGALKDTLKPRFVDAEGGKITQEEVDGRISEYQYSTVMDYGSRFNSDIQFLGKYDIAAIKYGYGRLVEVFDKVKEEQDIILINLFNSFGFPTPIRGNFNSAINYWHLPRLFDSLDDMKTRSDVKFLDMQYDQEYGIPWAAKDGRMRVPYKFCSDEFRGFDPDCNVYDQGADFYEIANDIITRYKNDYIFNNFKRDRLLWSHSGYVNRIMGRYLEPLRGQMQYFALYSTIFAEEAPKWFFGASTPEGIDKGWGFFTMAVSESFQLLGDIITMPEPGKYSKFPKQILSDDPGNQSTTIDLYLQQSEDVEESGEIAVPLGEGKFFNFTWDYNASYYWYERLLRVGAYLDKILAVNTITNPDSNFVAIDTGAESRRYAMNYFLLYPEQMKKMLGAVLTQEYKQFAPQVVNPGQPTQSIYRPNWLFGDEATVQKGIAIDPWASTTVQDNVAIYGVIFIPASWDTTWRDEARIFLAGNGEAIDLKSDDVTTCYDPTSGRTYVAKETFVGADGQAHEGIGSRMLRNLCRLKTDPTKPQSISYLNYVDNIEIMRRLTRDYL